MHDATEPRSETLAVVPEEGPFVRTFVGYDPGGCFLEGDAFLDLASRVRLLSDSLSGSPLGCQDRVHPTRARRWNNARPASQKRRSTQQFGATGQERSVQCRSTWMFTRTWTG